MAHGDGRVLIAGGAVNRGRYVQAIDSVEIYDPGSDSWRATTPMIDGRFEPQLVPLADGRVLAVGGGIGVGDFNVAPLAYCEIFDPAAETWTPTGTLTVPRLAHRAVPLPDGGALAIGGVSWGVVPGLLIDDHSEATVERWNPITGGWTTAARLPHGRSRHHAVALTTGEVLVFGGVDEHSLNCGFTATIRYDPAIDAWTVAAPMVYDRHDFAATLLTDGRVLAAGGNRADELVTTAEEFIER